MATEVRFGDIDVKGMGLRKKTEELVQAANNLSRSLQDLTLDGQTKTQPEPTRNANSLGDQRHAVLTEPAEQAAAPAQAVKTVPAVHVNRDGIVTNFSSIFASGLSNALEMGAKQSRSNGGGPCKLAHIDEVQLKLLNARIKEAETLASRNQNLLSENNFLKERLQSVSMQTQQSNHKMNALQSLVTELQTNLSRQALEVKALNDQNVILRNENKRLFEQGAVNKESLARLEKQLDEAQTSGGARQDLNASALEAELRTLRTKVAYNVEQKLVERNQRLKDLSTSDQNALSQAVVDLMLTTKFGANEDDIVSYVSDVLGHYNNAVFQMLDELRQVETDNAGLKQRVEELLKMSTVNDVVNEELTLSRNENMMLKREVQNLKLHQELAMDHQDEINRLQNHNAVLKQEIDNLQQDIIVERQRIAASTPSHDRLLHELQRENNALHRQIQEVLKSQQRLNEELVMLRAKSRVTSPDVRNSNMEELLAVNEELKAHALTLEDTIREWQKENSHLRHQIMELQHHTQSDGNYSSPGNERKWRRRVDELENRLEDLKLEYKKRGEIIKSLTEELEQEKRHKRHHGGYETGDHGVESVVEQLVATIKNNMLQDDRGERTGSNFEDVEKIFSIMKENQETSEMLGRVQRSLEESKRKQETVSNENKSLKARLKGAQEKLQSLTTELANATKVLKEYETQYHKIHVLQSATREGDADLMIRDTSDHPLPFLHDFKNLFNAHQSISHTLKRLQESVKELQSTNSSQEMQIRALTRELDDKVQQIAVVEDSFVKFRDESRKVQEEIRQECDKRVKNVTKALDEKDASVKREMDKNKQLSNKLRKLVVASQALMVTKEDTLDVDL